MGCLELYFHQGDAGRECGRAKEDVDDVIFTSSCPQGVFALGLRGSVRFLKELLNRFT